MLVSEGLCCGSASLERFHSQGLHPKLAGGEKILGFKSGGTVGNAPTIEAMPNYAAYAANANMQAVSSVSVTVPVNIEGGGT